MTARALTAILWLATTTALAFIDPRYTPVELVRQSQLIAIAAPKPTADATRWTLEVVDVAKGKAGEAIPLDLATCRKGSPAQFARLLASHGAAPAILFAGTQNNETLARLHVAGRWLAFAARKGGGWDLVGHGSQMDGIYTGGTDVLIRMILHLLSNPEATVPAGVGTVWAARSKLGVVQGEAAGLACVELGAGRVPHLFVGCAGGDRLFRPRTDADAMTDVTARARLATRSRRFAWIDMDRDGLADLVTWDGQRLAICRATRDGTLARPRADETLALSGPCLALHAVSVAADGAPAILVSTDARLFLLTPAMRRVPLPLGEAARGLRGPAAACIVADLDGDGFPDVLQPCRGGGRLWMGKAGGFGPPSATPVAGSHATVGDFDGDGRLDVFIAGPRGSQLWENDGRGGFRPVIDGSGSLSLKAPAGIAGCAAMDLNHDGRSDLALSYADSAFLYHFNRGFRCFGEQGGLRLTAGSGFKGGPASDGVRAVAVADFSSDGGLDLVAAFVGGEVYCYYNHQTDRPAVAVRLKRGTAGPVTVSLWQGKQRRVATATGIAWGHSPPAMLCLPRPGRCTLTYRLPGRPEQSTELTVGKRTAAVTIGE